MIIPMICFSCGKPIAHLWENYLDLVKHYELEGKIKKNTRTPEFLALAQLKIGRECCRRMFLCQHDMYEKVR
jgi:DNA-directed RNA polymerase subunit N (RpoN/RPB10)